MQMLKKFLSLLLGNLFVGACASLIATWIEPDLLSELSELCTQERILGIFVVACLSLLLLACLESEWALPWNWRWHRFWYLWDLKGDPQLRQWEKNFAQLDLSGAQRSELGVKVIADEQPQELIKVLRDVVTGQRAEGSRALVLGEPGAGKTTGLSRLALDLARHAVRRLGFRQAMPVLVRLGNFQEGKLLAYVGQAMRNGSRGRNGKILAIKIEELVEQGRVVLLLDALDEALGERREVVLAQLADFLKSRAYEHVPVIITTRTHQDPGGRLAKLQRFKIQDLNDDALELFIRAYKQGERSEQQIQSQLERDGLLEPGGLGRNPFWLRLIVQNDAFRGNKSQILNDAVDVLLRREKDKPETRLARLRDVPSDEQLRQTKRGLAWLAYRMSVLKRVALSLQTAQNELREWLKMQGVEGLRAWDILELGRNAQLLVYQLEPVQFRHRLLQEFMAAWALAVEADLLTAAFLAENGPDTDWWGESLLMLASLVKDKDHTVLVQDVLGHGSNNQRLFLAMVLLRMVENPDQGVTQEVTAALVKSLHRGVTEEHKQAAIKLAKIAGDKVVEALGKLLKQKNLMVKKATIEILGEIGDNKAAKVLTSLLKNEMVAAPVIEQLKSIGEPAVEPLIETLGDKNDEVRKKASLALRQMAEVALRPLITRLENGKPQMRQAAASTLGQIGDLRAVEPLITMLENEKSSLCQAAAKALGQIGDQRAVQPLITALQNENQQVRWAAASALGQIEDQRAVQPLITVLQDEKWRVSRAAARALGQIGNQQAVKPLITALEQHEKPQVRRAAAQALGQIGDQRAVKPLTGALQDEDESVRQMAAEVLEKMAV